MKLDPVKDWLIARAVLHKKPGGVIVAPDAKRGTTRCYLIEEASAGAVAAGYTDGDIVVARVGLDLLFYGGSYHRVAISVEEIICRVRGVSLSEFVTLDQKPLVQVEEPHERAVAEAGG